MKSRKSSSSRKTCPICGKQVLNLKQHQKSKSCMRIAGISQKTGISQKSPVRKTKSRIRKTKSPLSRLLRKTKSPVKSPLRKTKSPVSRKKTCPICGKQVLNLKQHQKSKSCMRIAGISQKSPVRKTKSPVRKTKSPIRKTKSPVRKTKSPVRKTKSPIRKTKSIVKSPVSRKKTCQICNKQVLNLKQHQKSKSCMRIAALSQKSQVRKTKSPVKSPIRKTKSPVKSPIRKTKSPVKSPIRKTKSPVKSPIRKTKRKVKSPQRYGNIFNNVRPRLAQQNLDDFIMPYEESKCQDDCPICLIENDESDSIILRDCRHCFHLECLRQWWNHSSKCPSCNRIYGFQVGNMPMGTMSAILERPMLSGSRYNTIIITYNFPAGVTTPNQPNPGTPYPQDIRNCYLEASPEGYEVLDLLRRSFERGLTFTIGDSLTTGRRNVVVWNGVHHKTSVSGGPAGFGFPDPGYYQRVKDELRAKGIF
jgi:deltex-like protein